ncbi:NAD-dependent epimerase/dehydratase family protein [uncultured Cyclobacterium sp.]|uniref:NAD-dependent epimerase/dehydratase family protein n=1 Tax=uncultured Cyclobacterium sp. TaxID=453820 RepID=UPI0030EBBFCC|tara:strand:- start:40723 stop:41682 length:960 start_codon:yes stop_codon:yes gene_type:complete
MKVIIIGGTGHIGTYLVPGLVEAGHKVVCVSRQQANPYRDHEAWKSVEQVTIDRVKSEEKGDFCSQIVALNGDVVIDLICFTAESARKLAEALNGSIKHFLHCGSMWVHGYTEQVPTTEDQVRKPFGDYGIDKAKIEAYLHAYHEESGFPVTILHPGHIVGPGWLPVNPTGNFNPETFVRLANGEEVALPNFGMETVHHVHADDVAQAFIRAIENREYAVGESFHVVSEQALTLRGYAEAIARKFGQEAKLKFLPWEEWAKTVNEKDKGFTYDHIAHSPCGSIAKAKELIHYQPKYSSLQAIQEAVDHYFDKEGIKIDC